MSGAIVGRNASDDIAAVELARRRGEYTIACGSAVGSPHRDGDAAGYQHAGKPAT